MTRTLVSRGWLVSDSRWLMSRGEGGRRQELWLWESRREMESVSTWVIIVER